MDENDQLENFEAPAKLVAALKGSPRREIFIPAYVDRAVLTAAREHLAGSTKTRLNIFRFWKVWLSVAAGSLAVVIACLVIFERPKSYAGEDLNHDGRVDILDSFALARELKNGKPVPATFDVNGDGVVDERDVVLIATHAVQLGKGDHS